MKRLLIALCAVLPLGFFLGRRSKKIVPPPQPIVVSVPPVQLQPPAPPQLEGRLIPFRKWIARYRDILDPTFAVAVATVAAVAATWFALQTNSINSDQRDLLRRQVKIESSQALPAFRIKEIRPNSEKVRTLRFVNEGGQARNAVVQFWPLATISWTSTKGLSSITNVPVFYYIYGHPDEVNGDILDGRSHLFTMDDRSLLGTDRSFDETSDWVAEAIARMNDLIEERKIASDLNIDVNWLFKISYQDFQGNNREEYFGPGAEVLSFDDGIGWSNQVIYDPLSSEQGDQILEQIRKFHECGLTMNLYSFHFYLPSVDEWIDNFNDMIAGKACSVQMTSAIPESSPVALPN